MNIITEKQIAKTIKNVINEYIEGNLATPLVDNSEMIVEMARINMNENGKKFIFPSNAWEIKIWSDDHNPPHFHIKRNGWNVSFVIETGERLEILSRGSESTDLDYMCANVTKWLDSPCALLPQITNRQNANIQWIQIHG